ncbi:MAG TPA: hypothetical protein ENL03_00155, partial [Phycisphaerae bacterium]|nr:hypothetical protein [Phycisphaerae bacterium]
MKILKENLFLTVTTAITLIGVVTLYVMGSSRKDNYLEDEKRKIEIDREISVLTGVSSSQREETEIVRAIVEDDAEAAAEKVRKYNDRYKNKIIVVDMGDGRKIDLVPYPPDEWGFKDKA